MSDLLPDCGRCKGDPVGAAAGARPPGAAGLPVLPHAWADGFGVWHVRVPRVVPVDDPLAPVRQARRVLRAELEARMAPGRLARECWERPVLVIALSDAETLVYREGDPA